MNPEQNGGQLPPPTPDQAQQPNSQVPVSPVPSANPYEFIMNPQKPQRKPVVSGNSLMQRILIAVGGLVVLVVLAVVVSSLIGASGKENTQGLLAIAQEQTELVRIATDGTRHTTALPAQNLAQNILASVTSDNAALLDYMSKNGQKVDSKSLTAKRSTTTDSKLSRAQESNTYDSAFKDVIQADLNDYLNTLATVYKSNPGPTGKALLSKQYDAAKLLQTASKAN